jgi:hypothetical protein
MSNGKRTLRFGRLAAAGALVLWAGAAQALQITGLAITTDPSNTANGSSTTGANRTEVASSAGLVGAAPGWVADAVGSSVSFDARYAALVAADRESGGGTTTQNAVASWSITFTIDNPTGGAYRIDIDMSRVGTLSLVTDSGGNATATLGALTATIDGAGEPGLGLAAQTLSGAASADAAVNQATTLSLFDSAVSRTVTIAFTWNSTASGAQDEAAVKLGIAGSLATTTADDYAGPTAGDGHLVGVGVTLLSVPVPEPDAAALLLLGLGGLALVGRPRGA